MGLVSPSRRVLLVACWLTAGRAFAALYPPLEPVWQITCEQGFYSPPTVVDGMVYASDVGGEVRAVSLADGAVKWSFKAQDSVYAAVAVAGALGYVASVDKRLYAVDLATGEPRWSVELDGVVYATPMVAGGTVLVGTGDTGTVYALDAATGAERWTFKLGDRMGSGLAVAGGLVYVGSYDRHLYAIDLATGQVRWEFAAEALIDSQPLVADGVAYLKLTNDAVCALDARTGKLAWRTTPRLGRVADEPTSWSPLAKVGEQLLLALSDGRLLALQAGTGEQSWITALGPIRTAPPTPAGELGWLGTKEGALAAIDLAAGATVWQLPAPKPSTPELSSGIMWPPVVVGDRLLAASMDGHLYAFRGAADATAWRPAGGGEPAAAAPPGPGRIAIGGLFPIGYAGCLARYGLPRDLLYEAQLADLETLRRYDLLILAGSPDDPAISAAVRQYVEGGGAAIIDYSASAITLPNLPNRNELVGWTEGKSKAPGSFGSQGLSLAPLPSAVQGGPLAGIPLDEGLVDAKSMGYLPDPGALKDVRVLASYPSTVSAGKDGGQANPAGGPAGRAMVFGRLGQGRVILCGPQVGLKSEYAGLDLEALILGMVKLATGGRAAQQLVPDTPHVGYNATLQSVSGADDDSVEEEPDDEPDNSPVLPGDAGPLPKGFALVEAEPAAEYDLATKVPTKAGEVLLHTWNPANYVRLTVGPAGIEIARSSQGRTETLESARLALPPGQPVAISDRCDTLTVRTGDHYVKADLAGIHPGSIAQRGLGQEIAYQATESVYFTDDFMRTDKDPGPWSTVGGEWSTTPDQNADMGANPFSYKCAAADGVATALAGQDSWTQYQFTCAVRPNRGAGRGTVGVGWYAQDADSMYLLRAAVREDLTPRPQGFQLLKLQDGQETVLAEHPGGVNEGQWYQFHIKAEGPWLSADVDGVRVLTAKDTSFSGGQIALRVERAAARFDDVMATAAVLPLDEGSRIEGHAPDNAGLIDVDSWASPATGWEPDPGLDRLFWRRNRFFGDVGVEFDWPRLPDGGEVSLIVDSDGQGVDHGYTLWLKRSGATGQLELRQQGKAVKSAAVPVGSRLKLGFRRTDVTGPGAPSVRLDGLLGDQVVLSATVPRIAQGGRLGFRTAGFLPQVSALTVWSRNLRDYTFDTAPCDWWVTSGAWDLTNRWSCVPEWSWFGGYSEQQAAVWGKQQFVGDLVLDYYVGAKMLNDKVPGYKGKGQERTGDFNVTVCGDGRSTDSGYSFTLGPAGGPNELNTNHGRISGAGAQLRRNGQVVARNDRFRFFSQGHNRWANLRVLKQGAVITLSVDGQPVIQYTDPEPLNQGFVAIWTDHNGILVPRITIAYEALGEELLSLR